MDYFDESKKSMLDKLYKPDKSFKGSVDEDAIAIINEINSKKNYYTTSSCSGRISLFYESSSGKKQDAGWTFVEHRLVTKKEITDALKEKEIPEETLWFKMETPIFHVACRTNEDAEKLLALSMKLGFKRSGITSINRRVMVEIIFNDKIEVPVAMNKKLFVDDQFIEFLVEKANDKFIKNNLLLKRFENELKNL
jgi:tRNA wybutosine-synthesizing protein 3